MLKLTLFILCALMCARCGAEELCKTKLQTYFLKEIYEITLCKNKDASYDDIFKTEFMVELEYKMSASGTWIGRSSLDEIKKHYSLNTKEEAEYVGVLNEFFPNVKNGDRITMKFEPQKGAVFYYNGSFWRQISDITFAKRIANIWLHPNARFKDTRNFLLANE
jgi:hypothetical protein